MIKTREFQESNYRGVWFNGKTIRIALDNSKPITELEFPEFLDVKITDYCLGNCPYCYMNSNSYDNHHENIVEKINNYFGPMSENERPFQVAIGGGEPTSHPDFIKCLKAFKDLGIEPNYTTNGMFCKTIAHEDIIEATEKYCGGVAVSCHPHLRDYWEQASDLFGTADIKLNFHLIISDEESIKYFKEIY